MIRQLGENIDLDVVLGEALGILDGRAEFATLLAADKLNDVAALVRFEVAPSAGAAPSEIEEVMREVRAQGALELRGLMTMPPAGDLEAARRSFETLASLRNLHGGAAALPEPATAKVAGTFKRNVAV